MGPKVKTNAGGQHAQSKTVTAGITPTSDISMTSSLTSITSSIASQPASQLAPTIAVPPTYYIQHTHISIHAAKLDTWSFEKIAELDRGKNNWSDWSFAMKLVLNQHLVSGYLLGTIKAPDAVLEPSMFNNWMLNNIAIVSALCSHVSHEDQWLLKDVTNAKEAWDTLHEHHKKVGPIAQILLIQEDWNPHQGSFPLHCHAQCPVRQTYCSAVQTQAASLLSSSSKDRLFTSTNIHACLNTEQQLLDNEKAHSADITLATSTCPKHGNYSHSREKMCSLCAKCGHTVEGCWQPRGGMAV
ncbi:hypothetical protein BDN67DRAFT_984921 [Paxillus ammoniavirescens]|nr:hypothetical protein BDN67DRAFT_984921 [Paxillus ammoniavirescens]